MRRIRPSHLLPAITVLLMLAGQASAAQPYAIIQAGQSQSEFSNTGDETDTTFTVGLGTSFTDHFGLEAMFQDMGSIDFGRHNALSADPQTFSAAFVGHLPVGTTVSLYGKVGVDFWDADIEQTGLARTNSDDDGTDLFYAGGVAFDLTQTTAITAEYERHEFDDLEINVLDIGLRIRF